MKTLNVPSTALGFAGGFPGQFIDDTLKKAGIQTDFIEIDEDTRINVKLKTGDDDQPEPLQINVYATARTGKSFLI